MARTPPGAVTPAPQQRAKLRTRTRVDFWLDALLLAGYTLAYSFYFTGPALHEWLGLGLGLVVIVHLALHWDWVTRTTRQLLRRGMRQRLLFLVNLALVLSLTLCITSGVYISAAALPTLGIHALATHYGAIVFWRRLHHVTARLTLGLVPVHLALDWRWVARVARRIVPRRATEGSA
jgi:hypothetical protein